MKSIIIQSKKLLFQQERQPLCFAKLICSIAAILTMIPFIIEQFNLFHHSAGAVGCCTWGGWDTCAAWTNTIQNFCQMNVTSCESCSGEWITTTNYEIHI
mmetsp:Transcript_5339/g.6222  ORF Transcript_5339/g.6222 Transcript_5339/m.6222 type:complete len:100 (+) Transcript_5339:1-300(+)